MKISEMRSITRFVRIQDVAKTEGKNRSKAKWFIGAGLGLLLALTGATAAYSVYFDDHALPRVTVAGESVLGMTEDKLIDYIEARAKNTAVRLNYGDQSTLVPLSALGVKVDAEAMAKAAFAPNATLSSRLNTLFSPVNVPTDYVLDTKSLAVYSNIFTSLNGEPTVDAGVTISEDGSHFVTTPATVGTGVSLDKLVDAVEQAVQNLTTTSIDLSAEPLDPLVDDDEAAATAAAANNLLSLDVSLVSDGQVLSAAASDKAQWVAFPMSDTGYADPKFDPTKVAAWIETTAQGTNTPPVDGVKNVNLQGRVLSTQVEARPGRSANNSGALGAEAAAALEGGNSFTGTLTYERTEGGYTERLVADGAENLIYAAAPGEKWVDINLSSYTVTPYQGATQVANTMYMVPGAREMPTPTGQFQVYLKYVSQTMRGTNLDGSRYETPNVPWVTYFTGSIAMHGAPWQPFFGPGNPNGSHGCVNMSVSDAQFIHGWTEMGTVVIVHY